MDMWVYVSDSVLFIKAEKRGAAEPAPPPQQLFCPKSSGTLHFWIYHQQST